MFVGKRGSLYFRVLIAKVGPFFLSLHHFPQNLRAAFPKFRLGVCKMKKSKIPKLYQNVGLDEQLLEKIL